ncbi:MAG: dimethyl sulfone monooxygenase SfnG [Dongiaceae bacterium]
MKFGYWATNLGTLVFSDVEQRTRSDFAYNAALAQAAEAAGFDYALLAARFISTTGAAPDLHDPLTMAAALAPVTRRLKLIAAIHPGLWHPATIAKAGATLDALSGGRFAINVVSGWFKEEFLRLGEPWLEHDDRYRRSAEFIEILTGLWKGDPFTFEGDYYHVKDLAFRPRPLSQPRPEIFQGGNSLAARRMAARHSDWYLMNGDTPEGARRQIEEITALAREHGRRPRFGINAFVILRDTEAEALGELEQIIARADAKAVAAFADHVKGAGASTRERIGMWADSEFANLVQPNDGFKTRLVGTPAQVIDRIRAYEEAGVDLILCGFLHFAEEVPPFGQSVIAQLAAGSRTPAA